MITNYFNLSPADIMATGGDARVITENKSGLNTYGHSPFPKFAVQYSSCTGNTISVSAYSYVASFLNVLTHEHQQELNTDFYIREFELIRKKIASYYELSPEVEMVFGSSGTDIELIQLALSLSLGKSVHNIVLAANEVGSGTENAAKGCYFSDLTPTGYNCKIGEEIPGFSNHRISYANIDIRDCRGNIVNEDIIHKAYIAEIDFAIRSGKRAIVHTIHRSKTGLIVPHYDIIYEIVKDYGDHIDLVVDCCQGRVSIKKVNEYLNLGASLLLTGSKFYSGPPFSGILLLPVKYRKYPIDINNYSGLRQFFSIPEYPLRWQKDIPQITDDENNLGLLLRWKAAVYEMNKVFLIPNHRIEFVINSFTNLARRMISQTTFLNEISAFSQTIEDTCPTNTKSPFELNTIITFAIYGLDGSELTIEDAKIIHKALYTNLEPYLSQSNKILSLIVQLGQPVKIKQNCDGKWGANLRIALSSNLIGELGLLDDDIIHMRFYSDMQMIHDKIKLVLQNLDLLREVDL